MIPLLLILPTFLVGYLTYKYYRVHFYSLFFPFVKPKYRVISEKNVKISMPDGTHLAMDIHRPDSLDKFPVLLIRTPYNKSNFWTKRLAILFASQGYALVIQDVRGKYQSEGEFYPYAYEALDGHVTVTWAGETPWSNGRVGLFGISYSGSCAWLAARYKSPYLKTIISMFTTQNTYDIWIQDGVPFFKGPIWWLCRMSGKRENKSITDKFLEPYLWHLPTHRIDEEVTATKILFYNEYLSHPYPDSFWEEISAVHNIGNIDVAAYIVGGWYDPFLIGTIEDYQRMKIAPATTLMNRYSRLIIGPWSHVPSQKFKGMDLSKDSDFGSMVTSVLDWCDIWLKDKKPPTKNKVLYYLMGTNEWKETDDWPPENEEKKLYLSSENESTNLKNGQLLDTLPVQEQKNHYVYNPRDPILFRGSYLLHGEGWVIPVDQKEITIRDDILIFSSPPLTEDLIIVGNIRLVLYVSSDALDTDFYAKICDESPNGTAFYLTFGFVRMKFRNSVEHPELMEPGKIYRIEITLKPFAFAFLKGNRIQLQIASADFPVHNRNLNTGLSCETSIEIKEANQTVYTGSQYDSHLILPVLRKDK